MKRGSKTHRRDRLQAAQGKSLAKSGTPRAASVRRLLLLQKLTMGIGASSSLAEAMSEALKAITSATGWEYGEGWLGTRDARSGDHLQVTREACWPKAGARFADLRMAAQEMQESPASGLPAHFWSMPRARWLEDLSRLNGSVMVRRKEAQRAGVHAVAMIPIFDDGQRAAMLLLFVCRKRPDDKELLEVICSAVTPLRHLVRRKLAEDELAAHHEQLERIIEERTRQLESSRERLVLSDRMASLGSLAAGLGHDMNNVLLPVRAHLNALKAREEREMQRAAQPSRQASNQLSHLDAIDKSVAYLQQLADGLHFLALDPEQDDSAGDHFGTELHRWWSQTGVLLSKAVPRHVKLMTSLPSDLPRVRVAAHRLTQAMMNLVVNAGEAIPADATEGTVRVWARAAQAADGSKIVRVSVTDNGVGMAEDVQQRSFDMFYSTKTKHSGAGLGLAMVRRMVDRAHGAVEIESAAGQGTTVTLVLPAVERLGVDHGQVAMGPMTAVAIPNGRAAALVRQFAEAAGARIVEERESPCADVHVVDPAHANLPALRKWRKRCPEGRLVLFGAPPERYSEKWKSLDPIVVREPNKLEAIRAALKRALSRDS